MENNNSIAYNKMDEFLHTVLLDFYIKTKDAS